MIHRSVVKSLLPLLVAALTASPAFAVVTLFSAEDSQDDAHDNHLYELNPADGSTVRVVEVILPDLNGFSGLAANPGGTTLYALARIQGQGSSHLVSIDPGAIAGNMVPATDLGDMGEAFIALAFNNAGRLFGVTDDDFFAFSLTPKSLYEINPLDGSVIGGALHTFDGFNDDDALALNSDDGLLYHAGNGDFDPLVFESFDPDALPGSILNIAPDAALNAEANALTYGNGQFYWVQNPFAPELLSVDTNGNATSLGPIDHMSKGLAFVDVPRQQDNVIPEPITGVLGLMGVTAVATATRRNRR